MDGNYVSREVHEEFRRSMEAEHRRLGEEDCRQNRRLDILEESIKQISAINTSIERLAVNMESMLKEQVSQGKRLELLENRDGDMWRKAVGYAVTAIIGVVLGYIFKQMGF